MITPVLRAVAFWLLITPGVLLGQERPGWIGVSMDISTALERGEAHTTVRISDVRPGSPAAEAGVRPGDTLLEVNDMVGPAQLSELANRLRLEPGDTVRLMLQREGDIQEIHLIAAERPASLDRVTLRSPLVSDSMIASIVRAMDSMRVRLEEDRLRFRSAPGRPEGKRFVRERSLARRVDGIRAAEIDSVPRGFRFLVFEERSERGEPAAAGNSFSPLTPYLLGLNRIAGAEVIDLRHELASYFGVENGVLVVDVPPGTPAEAAGLQPGDVIASMDGVPVGSVAELRAAVARRSGARPLVIIRRGETLELRLSR